MWTITSVGVPSEEPISLADAQGQCMAPEVDFQDILQRLCKTARDHVERYCNMNFAVREIKMECQSWAELAALPVAPVTSITTVRYIGVDGIETVLDEAIYERSGDRFSPLVRLKSEQSWPPLSTVNPRITLTVSAGGQTPENVRHAMLLLVGHWFAVREAVNVGNLVSLVPAAVDDLLANDRRYS